MGLGQIYNGQIGKGIIFIILYGISVALMFVVIGFITIHYSGYGVWLMLTIQQRRSMRIWLSNNLFRVKQGEVLV